MAAHRGLAVAVVAGRRATKAVSPAVRTRRHHLRRFRTPAPSHAPRTGGPGPGRRPRHLTSTDLVRGVRIVGAATTYAVRKLALPETRWAARVDDVTARALPRLQAEQQKLSAALAAHPDKSTSALTDALSDPFAGSLSDRTRSKWGRRHPYMFASPVFIVASFVAIFNPPAALQWQQLLEKCQCHENHG